MYNYQELAMVSGAQLSIFTPAPEELTWKQVLNGEREAPYFRSILSFLEQERQNGKTIYPRNADIFNALQLSPFNKVKVVLLGQDPYHGPNQAHGLCFSVKKGVLPPPSLQNIFLEIKNDLALPIPKHGCLEKWAAQGVLLLNAVLTVEAGKPQSHRNIGWEIFTDKVIKAINDHRAGVVFLLWGADAQKKGKIIDASRHHILKAAHPSPFSVQRGFFGCKHFSKTNALLAREGKSAIDWQLD